MCGLRENGLDGVDATAGERRDHPVQHCNQQEFQVAASHPALQAEIVPRPDVTLERAYPVDADTH